MADPVKAKQLVDAVGAAEMARIHTANARSISADAVERIEQRLGVIAEVMRTHAAERALLEAELREHRDKLAKLASS
jgi:hypothetical protein